MFKNIGNKIRILAKIIVLLGLIIGIGFIFLDIYNILQHKNNGFYMIINGIFIIILTYIFSLPLYGFGELIENTSDIKISLEDFHNNYNVNNANSQYESKRNNKSK